MQKQPVVIDIPTFGAGLSTVGDLLADGLEGHLAPGADVLTVRFVTSPVFEVRGLGDTELLAQLLARPAIDNGFRSLHICLLEPLAAVSADLLEQLEHKLPAVVALEVTITQDGDPPSIVLGPEATPAEFRDHLSDALSHRED